MSLEARISQDLKAAMLAGQKERVTTLRGLRSVLLYAKVAAKLDRTEDLADEAVVALFAKEAKKRQESADLYIQGGNQEKADAELAEKNIIEVYLPEQLSEEKLLAIIDAKIADLQAADISKLGQVIGAVKQEVGSSADGAAVARLVKERLS